MQKVAKFNELEKFGEEAGNQVRVYVSTFRLKDVTTDLVRLRLLSFSHHLPTCLLASARWQLTVHDWFTATKTSTSCLD
jgi:hypothetical protein